MAALTRRGTAPQSVQDKRPAGACDNRLVESPVQREFR